MSKFLVASHRYLYVRIAAPRFQALVCSIHGMDRDHGEAEVCEFCEDQVDRVRSVRRKGDRLIILVDGNCRVCSNDGHDDSIIGNSLDPPTRHTFVSDAFVGFCRKVGLMIPVTFAELDGGSREAGSLYSSIGRFIRCD